MRIVLCSLWMLVNVGNALAADTIVTQRMNAQNRLIPLKKLTIGPDDQYHGVLDPTGSTLIFTRKTDMIPHLCSQDLKSGKVRDLLDLSADSQEAVVSPRGVVAFTYYKFNARGDVCYRALNAADSNDFKCLKSDGNERSAPFWKSARELGYLYRNLKTQVAQVVVENLDTGTKQVLAEGSIWSPTMKPGGRYLFYNELPQGEEKPAISGPVASRVLAVKDLQGTTNKVIHFQLPGMSGFPAVSDDEKYLYFSAFLNDTNHDNVIDGNDNSVIFRAPIASLLEQNSVFPEQLTSAESNCSLPYPHEDKVFATCAFEGTLDVYAFPNTGIVPSPWDQKMLMSAHESSRSYEDRVLLLNTLKFRFANQNAIDLEERLMSDHLLADDTTAAKFYLTSLQQSSNQKKDYYALLGIYLDGLEMKKSQPSEEEVSPTFQREISKLENRIAKVPGNVRFKIILRGLLKTFLNETGESQALLRQVAFNTPAQPLERYYYFSLADWVYSRARASDAMVKVYREMVAAPELSHESRIYYAYRYLQHVQDTNKTPAQRIRMLAAFDHGLPAPVSDLIQSEIATLKIIQAAPDKSAQAKLYPELDKYITRTHTDYFTSKALYVRSILNFADAAQFKYLNFIASNWIGYTAVSATEFTYAREVFVNANLDRAYDAFAQKDYQLASGYFYGSLTLTDDLESHYGYIRSMVLHNERKTIDVRYKDLQKRQFVNDNMKFVNALLLLIDAGPSEGKDASLFNKALEMLDSMQQDRDSPVRYLMLGYCYLEKLFITGDGYDFDGKGFEEANRDLMLAYDTGRENDRIEASALLNLGLLHQRVQNHGLAVRFFARRAKFGFTSNDESVRFGWFYARSLFYSHQYDQAALELTKALKIAPTAYAIPLKEHRAFYLQVAENFSESAEAYKDLLESHAIVGDLNLAKANLSYGYALFKLKKSDEAKRVLNESLGYANRLAVIPKGQSRLVDFQPIRLKLNAYGLLSQLGSDSERLQAIQMRAELLPLAKGLFDDGVSLQLQNRLQWAQLLNKTSPVQAAVQLQQALLLTEKLGDSGQYLSHAVFQSTVDYLAHAVLHPALYQQADTIRIQKIVDKTLQAYNQQKNTQTALEYQKLKLKLLWAAYGEKDSKSPTLAEFKDIRREIASTPLYSKELKKLADALEQRQPKED
jgi:hypothetical protein